MREPSEKTKRIISIVLSLAVLAVLLPMTGIFSKNPPASTTTGTGTLPPSVTLPPVTSAPIIAPPPVTDMTNLVSFDMESTLPEAGAILLSGAQNGLRADRDGDRGYLTLSAIGDGSGKALWGKPTLSLEYRGESYAQANESSFAIEATFIKNASTVPVSLSLLTDTDLSAEQALSPASEELLTLSESGVLTIGVYTLGSISSETLAVSILFTYSEKREQYLADVYVNGILSVTDLPYATLGGVSAKDIWEKDSHGILGMSIASDAIYTDAAEGNLTVGDATYAPTHYGAFASGGTLKYSLKLDDLYLTKGAATPKTAANASTLVLYASGKAIPGFTTSQSNASVVSRPVTPIDGKIALPEIAGGWRDYRGMSTVTEVTAAFLSRSGYAAYAPLPDGTLYENGFSENTDGLTADGVTLDTAISALLFDGGSHLSYSFGSDYRTGYDPRLTFSIVLKIERLAEDAPTLTLSLAGEDGTAPYLLSLREDALDFAGGAFRGKLPSVGEETEILLQINFSPSEVLLTVYTNGMYTGYAKLENATLSINTETETDLDRLSVTIGDGADGALALHELAVSRGSVAPALTPLPDATIRIGETDYETGLRFTFAVNRIWYEKVAKNITDTAIGALILPTDLIPSDVPLTHEALDIKGIDYIELATETFDGDSSDYTNIYSASIVHIQEQNRARSFTAVGYVRIDEDYYYSTESNSYSIIEAARNYVASDDFESIPDETKIRIVDCLYLSSIVCLDESYALIEAENYPSPYSVSIEGRNLVIRVREGATASLSSIKAVVIGRNVYNDGWIETENRLIAQLY